MRAFIDVGAHDGQTLEEVSKERYGFDLIYAFEPMPIQYANLISRFEQTDQLRLLNYGLADSRGARVVYGNNEAMEASVYPTKNDLDPTVATECEFWEASEFIAMFLPGDTVIMKLNCEGSEALILDNLIDTGEIWKLSNVMVDFDVRKIPEEAHREAEVLARLAGIGFHRYSLCEDVMHGETHQERIAAWLDTLSVLQ